MREFCKTLSIKWLVECLVLVRRLFSVVDDVETTEDKFMVCSTKSIVFSLLSIKHME